MKGMPLGDFSVPGSRPRLMQWKTRAATKRPICITIRKSILYHSGNSTSIKNDSTIKKRIHINVAV